MKELFEKVYIKTEDDLPKEEGTYMTFEYGCFTESVYRKNFVEYYLRPVTEPLYEKEFVEWKDMNAVNYVLDGKIVGYMIGKTLYDDKTYILSELHDHWLNNIKKK